MRGEIHALEKPDGALILDERLQMTAGRPGYSQTIEPGFHESGSCAGTSRFRSDINVEMRRPAWVVEIPRAGFLVQFGLRRINSGPGEEADTSRPEH